MFRPLRFLSALAVVAFLTSCNAQEHVVLIDVYSQDDVASLEMVVISVDGLGPPDSPILTFSPARRADEIASDPNRVAVVLPRPANIVVHLRGTNSGGGRLIATRCYAVNGVVEDEVVLFGPVGSLDADGDSFLADPSVSCREPDGDGGDRPCTMSDLFVCGGTLAADCDDDASDDPADQPPASRIYPGAPIVCENGYDEDCDGDIDEACEDADGDGVTACSGPSDGTCDCDDSDPAINPTAADVCPDRIDMNCDDSACCDVDGDGFEQCRLTVDTGFETTGDCVDEDNDASRTIFPGATEICDTLDNNCNGLADEIDECRGPDLDGDNVTACSHPDAGPICDCNDCDASISGEAPERCGNGVDDDCDGSIDEACPAGDADNDGQVPPTDCDDTDPLAYTHASGDPVVDRCEDGIPQSCIPGDDRSCADDVDGDGFVEDSAACEGNAAINPDVAESCNGIDDDCDGITDEAFEIDPSGATGCVAAMTITYASDFQNCGGCRVNCDPQVADECRGGVCSCAGEAAAGPCAGTSPQCCPAGAGSPVSYCADLDEDEANCGGCGRACGSGELCVGGVCTCGAISGDPMGEIEACPEPVAGRQINHCCSGMCRDVRFDASNCNGCDRRCGANTVCTDTVCECDAPTVADCNMNIGRAGGDGCEIPLTTVSNCGGCGISCGTSEACNSGTCQCGGGIRCAGSDSCCPGSGGCVNTSGDVNNCGGCGTRCMLAHATPTCTSSSCRVASCDSGWANCDGIHSNGCETSIDTDANCGTCGNSCGSNASCSMRACACDAQRLDCTAGSPYCEVAYSTSNCGGCGAVCGTNESCNTGGRCVCGGTTGSMGGGAVCSGASSRCCGGSCATLGTTSNCLDCGDSCDAGESCTGGGCRCGSGPDCPGSQTCCAASNSCVNLSTDLANCGGCGVTCGAGETCSGGRCVCDGMMGAIGGGPRCTGATTCCTGGGCVDTATDESYCGDCVTSCGSMETCTSSSCGCGGGATCTGGDTCCGGSGCADLTSDAAHCGGCGAACGAGESCCGASGCVDQDTDVMNCGGCGVVCGTGETCDMGTCMCGSSPACTGGDICCTMGMDSCEASC